MNDDDQGDLNNGVWVKELKRITMVGSSMNDGHGDLENNVQLWGREPKVNGGRREKCQKKSVCRAILLGGGGEFVFIPNSTSPPATHPPRRERTLPRTRREPVQAEDAADHSDDEDARPEAAVTIEDSNIRVDELYTLPVPDHLKERKNSEESSTQWITGIAEVQLPIVCPHPKSNVKCPTAGLLERNYAEAAAMKAAPQADYLFIPGNDCHSLQRLIGVLGYLDNLERSKVPFPNATDDNGGGDGEDGAALPWYMTRRLPYQTLKAQMAKVMPLLPTAMPLASPCLSPSRADSSSAAEN
uniref:Uncharacterized protein n=1 Tax=Oryza meridionalis TaxID=40149 RepID=A0A0E0CH29_9ORYZ